MKKEITFLEKIHYNVFIKEERNELYMAKRKDLTIQEHQILSKMIITQEKDRFLERMIVKYQENELRFDAIQLAIEIANNTENFEVTLSVGEHYYEKYVLIKNGMFYDREGNPTYSIEELKKYFEKDEIVIIENKLKTVESNFNEIMFLDTLSEKGYKKLRTLLEKEKINEEEFLYSVSDQQQQSDERKNVINVDVMNEDEIIEQQNLNGELLFITKCIAKKKTNKSLEPKQRMYDMIDELIQKRKENLSSYLLDEIEKDIYRKNEKEFLRKEREGNTVDNLLDELSFLLKMKEQGVDYPLIEKEILNVKKSLREII